MIGKLAIAVVVAAVLAGALCGCWADVKAPEGPYVTLDSGGDASGKIRVFLREARNDGVITKDQYRALVKRLEKD